MPKHWNRRPNAIYDDKVCHTKTRWSDERNAQRALTALRKANPGAFDFSVRPCRCAACKRWHLGHGQ